MDWIDYFRSKRQKTPEITQPIAVPEIREYAAPVPDPKQQGRNKRRWDWYMRTEQGRQWATKGRQA